MEAIDSSGLNLHHRQGLLSVPTFHRRRLHQFIVAATGATLCSLASMAHSLGLGEIQSTTYIGQPLKANIELVSVSGDISVDRMIVRQVSATEAEELGVELTYQATMFEFEIVESPDGVPYISVASNEAVKEPYLNLLIELRWPNGVVYREYPVLLDPPPKAPVATSRENENSQQRSGRLFDASAPPRSGQSSNKTVAGNRSSNINPVVASDGKYRVKPGDTLSKIAERWREGTDRGIYDTMQWLYENNLQAFTNQNIDLLRAGAVLQMPDLSAYAIDNEVPTAEQQAKAIQVKEPNEDGVRTSEQEATVNELVRTAPPQSASKGLLTVGTVNQDDTTRELIDMLVRENESLRARMEKIENSEYLDTLKQLIVLQRKEISDLRDRIGVSEADNNEKISELLEKIGGADEQRQGNPIDDSLEIVVSDEQQSPTEQASLTEVELASENVAAKELEDDQLAPVKVDPVLSAPVMASEEDKSYMYWVILSVGGAIILAFALMLVYFRKTSTPAPQQQRAPGRRRPSEPTSDDFDDELEPDTLDDTQVSPAVEPAFADEAFAALRDDEDELIDIGDDDVTLTHVRPAADESRWMGETAEVTQDDIMDMDAAMKEVQEAFDDLALDENALGEFESENTLEGMTEELDTNKTLEPRSDDEVRLSIAEKMAQYNPDDYRKEIESLGLLELDELNEFDEEHDEIDTTVYRAMMFCEFKKFSKARELIQAAIDQGHQDERLSDAMDQIDELENALKNNSKQAG